MAVSGTELAQTLKESFRQGTFVSLILARPRKTEQDAPRKLTVRPVLIKGETHFQWEQQFERQQTHVNRTAADSIRQFETLFDSVYQEAYLFTEQVDLIARVTGKGISIQRKPPSRLPQQVSGHDRQKERLIPEGVPCPFLVELDVMTADGVVKPSRQKKFRQINRYLEMVNDIVGDLPASGPLKIIDFGCGLSYLTFALHHLFHVVHGREVELLGIDQNTHVIERCQAIVQKLGLAGISFRSERIQSASDLGEPDLAVSLHACDTATDHALALSVGAKAKVILAAPCCQHELATKIASPSLEGMLRYGVLKERVAALATDALRAAALEAVGYRTQILEFIELEHTPKNLLIRAVAKTKPSDSGAQRYRELKEAVGVQQLTTDEILTAGSEHERA